MLPRSLCLGLSAFVLLTLGAAPLGAAERAASDSGGGLRVESPVPTKWVDIQTDLALWTGVVFVALLLILWKAAWKPLAKGLDQREANVAMQISQAEAANRQAKDLLAAYEQRLAKAEDEVRAIIDRGRRDAEAAGQELIDKARGEAQLEQQRAIRQIESAEAAALKSLADRSASLALTLAGRIVHAKLNRKDHEQLIEQAIKQFAQTN